MRTGTYKAICWFVLACGGVGIALLVWVLLGTRGERPVGLELLVWLLASLGALVLSVHLLRKLYREEPRQLVGRWQLSLTDLIVVSLTTGLFIALWEAILPRERAIRSIPAGILSGAVFLGGLLTAARIGLRSGPWKYAFAVGIVLRITGYIGMGVFAFIAAHVLIRDPSDIGRYLENVFLLPASVVSEAILLYIIRFGLASIVPGLLLCHFALRHVPVSPKAPPPAEPADASKDVSA